VRSRRIVFEDFETAKDRAGRVVPHTYVARIIEPGRKPRDVVLCGDDLVPRRVVRIPATATPSSSHTAR
jgi:hypothetical protein